MSQRQNKTGVPHLVFQAKTGFQYYLTFPKHFALDPQLPAQIRWSLGYDEALARGLAEHLNPRFKHFLQKSNEDRVQFSAHNILFELEELYHFVQKNLESTRMVWRIRPSPTKLASADPMPGYERLMKECQEHPVLFTEEPGGEIHFALFPSKQLTKVLNIGFTRFDWPLGTRDPEAANSAAVYIYNAIIVLETLPLTGISYAPGHPLVSLMSFYEYLCFARPDQGRNLLHIPPGLPQSAYAVGFYLRQQAVDVDSLEICGRFTIVQEETGLYSLRIPLSHPRLKANPLRPGEISVELLTSSPIVAMLLIHTTLIQIDKILLQSFVEHNLTDAFERAMQEISDLIRRTLGPIPPAGPMTSLPELVAANDTPPPPQDAGTLALLSALSSVLPDAQKTKLAALFDAPAANDCVIAPASISSETLHFGGLIKEYEERQIREGAWTNPRTRITMHSRLEGLAELIGGHRTLDSLSRSDFNALRDQLRCYPKNRHRLRATRYQPLGQIIQNGKYEAINARTAKKFFELARAVVGYAHDQGYLKENLAAGLTFSTKGSPTPRKRTYSPRQIEQLLNGPVYTLKEPPRWRLDDYRFWLPILGLYSGARLSELCQLQLGDIREELGVWVISITSSGARQLKTADSERLVPLHKVLLDAGFLEFHQQRLGANNGDLSAQLFDSIRVYRDLSPGHVASRWFIGSSKEDQGYLGQCGLGDDELTFHGLRHTFINQFRRQKLDMLIGKALVGHADRSTTGGYGDCYPSYVLKEELDKIDFEVPVEHIHYSRYLLLKDRQGSFKVGRPAGNVSINASNRSAKRHWKSFIQK
ncbi:site-specific integrase [Stutzerimonas nitrititolerans]|uniref:site-specific integrase n=1 Tax=Stutzerimonas nitrititolerans TaxID=2482751 RepID=UPI003F7F99AD